MQISAITIENAKGIKKAQMRSISPINVLIGRNNSGKSSVLGVLRLLCQYFSILRDVRRPTEITFGVPDEFFRRGSDLDDDLRIAVTISQSTEERRAQFLAAVSTWNTQFQRPQMDVRRVDLHLGKDLFREITFTFGAQASNKRFGLEKISTTSIDVPSGTEVVVANAASPGGALKSLELHGLFRQGRADQCDSIQALAAKGYAGNLDIHVRGIGLDCSHPIFVHHLILPAFETIGRSFSSVSLLNAYRHGQKTAGLQIRETLADDCGDLVNFTLNLHLNNHAMFVRIADLVKRVVPEVGRLHIRSAEEKNDTFQLAYEWPDGRVINLANMGGGIEQLVILGCALLAQKSACILWEEPESHLHPGAQDVLLSELESQVGENLVFITTHSPVFVRASHRIAVHAITNPDGKNAVGRTLPKDGLQEACTILGSRPGHLAQADIVLYVEGKYGAAVVEEWLKKWPDREKVLAHLLVVVQSCNADEIGTDDFDLATLKALTPNMMIFVDKDNDKGSPEPKVSRKKLVETCKGHNVPCIVTGQRQIEDYFTEPAIRRVLPSNLLSTWVYDPAQPMSTQLHRKWKKHNRRIAEAMTWHDVEKHKDIMRLFKQIATYADMLRP